jgi:hypothetical protein
MHLGTLLAVVTYFALAGPAPYPVEALTRALGTALAIHTGYALLARWLGELKYTDVAVWLLFAIGMFAVALGAGPLIALYRWYSPALLFGTLAVMAFAPLALGRQPFTVFYGVRQAPRWQHATPAFMQINRVMAAFWGVVFVGAAALCAARPTDPLFTGVYANLLILVVGIPAAWWLPPLWMRVAPAPPPDTAEPLILGMPFAFDARAAGDARAVIQFRVTGTEPGDYWVRLDGGRCESFEGVASAPDLVVRTPGEVWVGIARGEIDGMQALIEGRYAAEGDLTVLARLGEWFRLERS